MQKFDLPTVKTSNDIINKAYNIAVNTILDNIKPYQSEYFRKSKKCLFAGADYNRPWTRDGAINTWNGTALLVPDVSLNTLLSSLQIRNEKLFIGDQYWDAVIWGCGAWQYYLQTENIDFLKTALDALQNTVSYFEKTEFDQQFTLFRGPACYGDGISAYPDKYVSNIMTSHILDWPKYYSTDGIETGEKIPIFSLSTNCLYYYAYVLMQKMTAALGLKADPKWSEKAGQLKNSINQKFWQKDNKKYLYLFDKDGGCDHSEALGNCFSILFGIADEQKAHYILKNQKICPSGIPCLWPNYERYNGWGKDHFGRQSGTVWPFIQALWAEVAFLYNKFDLFRHELINLSENIVESQDCYEIFHPVSGKPYGGLQEVNGKIELWRSCKSQTWSATGFIRMILMGLLGMRFEPKGLSLQPHLPSDVDEISVSNIRYRKSNLNIKIVGKGNKIQDIKVNGQSINTNTIPYDDNDEMSIHIKLNSEFKDNYPIKNYNTFETVDFIKSVRS